MPNADIQTFIGNLVAIYRPVKKTYAIIEWIHQNAYWKRYLVDPDHASNISIRIFISQPATVKINISSHATHYVNCVAAGEYLFYDNRPVPIIQKLPASEWNFPQSFYAGEFTCDRFSEHDPNTVPTLWTVYPPIQAQPQPNVVTNAEPLPKRIAWLVAEDASKKGETCSITLDPISPITASVTSCYHVFDKDAIQKWLLTNPLCPMCKKPTKATPAFE
jgi:hypothetical protein